jgi:hypothetical protein
MGLVAVAATCLLTASAIAQSPVGTWKGKLNMKMPPMPAGMDPKMKAMVEQQMGQLKKMVVNLNMKKDNTYVITTTGGPQMAGNDEDKGTWKQSGKTVTITSTKKRKNMGEQKPQAMTLSNDGKTMTLTLKGPGGASQGAVTFTKK